MSYQQHVELRQHPIRYRNPQTSKHYYGTYSGIVFKLEYNACKLRESSTWQCIYSLHEMLVPCMGA